MLYFRVYIFIHSHEWSASLYFCIEAYFMLCSVVSCAYYYYYQENRPVPYTYGMRNKLPWQHIPIRRNNSTIHIIEIGMVLYCITIFPFYLFGIWGMKKKGLAIDGLAEKDICIYWDKNTIHIHRSINNWNTIYTYNIYILIVSYRIKYKYTAWRSLSLHNLESLSLYKLHKFLPK